MRIEVIDQLGTRHHFERAGAASVMEMIRDHGLSIAAQCGGSAACATCHVYVDDAWLDRLPAILPMEEDMLELATEVMPNSRLSCQLRPQASLDGLVVTLAPGTEF